MISEKDYEKIADALYERLVMTNSAIEVELEYVLYELYSEMSEEEVVRELEYICDGVEEFIYNRIDKCEGCGWWMELYNFADCEGHKLLCPDCEPDEEEDESI